MTPLLDGESFASLREDTEFQDITFLSSELGEDPQRIRFLSTAHRLLAQTGIQAEVFYGLFRQQLPTELPALVLQHRDVLRDAVTKSIEVNIIPPTHAEAAEEHRAPRQHADARGRTGRFHSDALHDVLLMCHYTVA